ncbi:DEKNAAC100271 [Brettanomyces naardenensis]|uniref:DEKNAAC100271 n=1 Tax=Brettanomyces naardenensis TaxID=13370 RepID=A0A448YGK0_BRENA|nr:DEKNAAC100271 [Brettanomyces naardenensis]
MSTRSQTRHRNQLLVPLQKEYVAKHVHSNGPQDFPVPDPMDFSRWTEEQLRKYRELYLNPNHVISPDIKTFQGYMLEANKLGESTESYIKNEQNADQNLYDYRTHEDLRNNVEDHFNNHLNVKESEVIVNFLYKVKNEDKNFRLYFDRSN